MLPSIAPYPVPTEDELPHNQVAWRVDPARAVLLVHDMQNYFLAAFDSDTEPLDPVLDNIARLRRYCAELGVPVVFTGQPGGQSPHSRGLLRDFWSDGPPDDAHAVAIADTLMPGTQDVRLTKTRYSAFAGTELAELLGERDQLVLTGVYAHIGVLSTALDAFMRDIQPFVTADAVADFSRRDHDTTLRHVAGRCGMVATSHDVADGLLWRAEPTPEAVRLQVTEVLGEHVDAADNLMDAGLDSVRLMTLVQRWQATGREVSLMQLAEEPTVAAWARLLQRAGPRQPVEI